MIYAMQPIDGGPVKLGFTMNLQARHKQLEAHYGRRLAILATMDGDEIDERRIHKRFAHIRLPGRRRRGQYPEQFIPTAELMAFLGRPLLVGANHDAVEAMDPVSFDPNRPDDVSVFLDRRIVGKAKLIAKHEGVSVAALLSELTKAPVDKAYLQMLRDLDEAEKAE